MTPTSPEPRPIDTTFARQLKAERNRRGWSQSKVAELLDIETKTVWRWERSDSLPAPYLREKLDEILEKTLEELGLLETSLPATFVIDPMIPVVPPFRLVGRDEQISQLKDRLRQGGSIALSALNGLPGVGKTALSIALA